MARGNQREKAREKNLKNSQQVSLTLNPTLKMRDRAETDMLCFLPIEDEDQHERYPNATRQGVQRRYYATEAGCWYVRTAPTFMISPSAMNRDTIANTITYS
jgi:hypothetical protein